MVVLVLVVLMVLMVSVYVHSMGLIQAETIFYKEMVYLGKFSLKDLVMAV
jgi:hypothetical protein